MGRKQQQPRTSGNTKRASAERTATLLSNGGAVPALSAFFPSLSLATANDNESEITVDGDFRLLLKKFFKKDAVTKLKALEEFIGLVDSKSEESLLGVLPFWPRHFSRLGIDIDRRVRENTFVAHQHLCSKVRKNIAPYLKIILAPWLIGRFDSHGPAASAAERSFDTVFPERKHHDVIAFYLQDTIELLRRNLFEISVATVPDSQDLTEEEKVIKLVALQSGTLQALRFVIEVLVSGDQIDEKKVEPCSTLINDPKLLLLAKNEHAQVQRYLYELINVSIEKGVLKDFKTITNLTLGFLAGSEDPLTVSAIWQTSVQLAVAHPECWSYVSMEKAVLPQLKLVIKRRGSGSPQSVFQAVLLLFARMPDVPKYRADILSALRNCLTENVTTQTSVAELAAAAKALFECLRYEIVHKATDSAGVLQLVNDHHLPLLRKIIESKDPAITRVQPIVFRETTSLLGYLRRNSDDCEKYAVFESIYREIYSIMVEALDSSHKKAAILLHSHLNHPKEAVQTKKSLSFADDGDKQQGGHDAKVAVDEYLVDLNRNFLGRVLTLCSKGNDPSLFNLLGNLFPAHYTPDSKEYFKNNGFDDSWLLANIEKWIMSEDSAGTGVKMLLTLANSKPDDGVTDIVRMCEEKPQLLLMILEQAPECSCEIFRPILSAIFRTESFGNTISDELNGPRRLEIIVTCLSSSNLFPESITQTLTTAAIDDAAMVLTGATSDKIPLCEALSRIPTWDENNWKREGFGNLVDSIFRLSVTTLAELKEGSQQSQILATKLQTSWLTAIRSNCEPSRHCRLRLIADLRMKILEAETSREETNKEFADLPSIVESALCLLNTCDDENCTLLRNLIPSPEEFDSMVEKYKVREWIASEKLRQKNYEYLILHEDTPDEFMEQPRHQKLVSIYTTLFEICEARNATKLFDVAHLILVDLLEPQPKFKPVIASLLAEVRVAESTAESLRFREGIHWTAALDELMGVTGFRLRKEVWQNERSELWSTKWLGIKHSDREEDLKHYLSSTVDELVKEDDLETYKLCFVTGCLRKASLEGSQNTVQKIVSHMKDLLHKKPELFACSTEDPRHLAELSFLTFFVSYRIQCGGLSKEDVDLIVPVLEECVKTYPWHKIHCESSRSLATGIYLCDIVMHVMNLLSTEDGNIVKERDEELSDSFQEAVIKAMVPTFQHDSENLWKMPGLLLEHLTNVYVALDSSLLADFWMSQDGYPSIRDIMAKLCGIMQEKKLSLQLAAYSLTLSTIIETLCAPEQDQTAGSDLHSPIKMDFVLYGFLQDMTSSLAILKKSHGGFKSWELHDEKDLCVLSGYILAMSTTLLFCSHVNTEERSAYFEYVDEQGHWERYLNLLLEFVPDQPPSNAFVESALPRKFDFTHVVCWALFDISARAPGVMKSWYTKLNDHKKENRIKNLMTKYISPTLIGRELSQVQKASEKADNMTLSILSTTREIVARYTLEDIGRTCQVSVQMEPCHPLKPMRITYDPDKVTGSKSMWTNLIRQLNTFLHSSNGGIVEALRAWKENLDRKLEGGAECCICYSVLHASTLKLPNYPCMTCKYRFHKACMYKWFSQGNATCPLCRSALG